MSWLTVYTTQQNPVVIDAEGSAAEASAGTLNIEH